MDEGYWTGVYERLQTPPIHPVVVGFNVNLDRIIHVDKDLLNLPDFQQGDLRELWSRLIHSMEHCTAEEWFVSDRGRYDRFTDFFSGKGSLLIGGQAGIASLHLASLGISEVFCLAPAMGNEAVRRLIHHGVRVPGNTVNSGAGQDTVHLIFEYPPGIVPQAAGAVPRNNRFIASPEKNAENTILTDEYLRSVLPEISTCTRAFLSGYQYLHNDSAFAHAADQIRALKNCNPEMRVHIECVSVTDAPTLAGLMRHILPVADSAGMNEHELSLLPGQTANKTPAGLVEGILNLARETGLARIHLHTFGYYLLVIRKEHAEPKSSRTALLYAAQVVAEAAGGTTTGISPEGVGAVREISDQFGPGPAPGICTDGDYLIFAVPTLIASGIKRTVGLGDILSSTAFVADRF